MKVVVTRNMTVTNDNGEAELFEKSGDGEFREDIGIETYRRLNRAGAAAIFVEPTEKPAEGKGEETVEDLMKLNKDALSELATTEKVEYEAGANKQVIAEAIIAKRKAAPAE